VVEVVVDHTSAVVVVAEVLDILFVVVHHHYQFQFKAIQ
jgi:hypothetical protein